MFATARPAKRVMATRRAPEALRTPVHEAAGWASTAGSVTAFGLGMWPDISWILMGLNPDGHFAGGSMLRLMRNPEGAALGVVLQPPWVDGGGGGMAFHTAFTVFGVQRLCAYELVGPLAVPRMLPMVVGIAVIIVGARY